MTHRTLTQKALVGRTTRPTVTTVGRVRSYRARTGASGQGAGLPAEDTYRRGWSGPESLPGS